MSGLPAQALTTDETDFAELVRMIVSPTIGSLAQAYGPRTEVVLGDLTQTPGRVWAVSGKLTDLAVGDPVPAFLENVASEGPHDPLSRRGSLPSALDVRRSVLPFTAPSGRVVAALGVTSDVTALVRARHALLGICPAARGYAITEEEQDVTESFPVSVEMLAQGILRNAVDGIGLPVDRMTRAHKMAVTRELDKRGFFALRDAMDLAARALHVSRFSIYNYLNAP